MFWDMFPCRWCTVSQDKVTQLIHALKHVFRQLTQAVIPNNLSQIHRPGQALLTASEPLIVVGLAFTVSWQSKAPLNTEVSGWHWSFKSCSIQ